MLIGKTREETIDNIKNYLENPPMIALPGGSYCYFCEVELCRNRKHCSPQTLQIVLNKLINQLHNLLESESNRKFIGQFNKDKVEVSADSSQS